MNKNIKNVYYT